MQMADLGEDVALSVNSPARYAKLPADLAEKYSRTEAEYIFLFKGQLVDHYDGSRKLQRWTPTQEQITQRENLVASRVMWALNAQVSFNLAFATWMVGVAAALLGWRAGARRPVDG
jgi:hypothetical protein